jgi:Zn-finger nucleic acid-binding protein
MNCRNCAAPMELFDRRRYYFCKYCGTFEFIEDAGSDGIHVLQRRADAAPCPLCAAPLAKSLLDETQPVEYCERCRGVLIERPAFARAVQQRRSRASGPGATPAPIDRREFERRVTCPNCRTHMDVHPYYGPGNVIIDTCRKCDLVWLDFGELRQIDEAPGDDRGRPPRIAPPPARVEGRLGDDGSLLPDAIGAGPWVVDALFDVFS